MNTGNGSAFKRSTDVSNHIRGGCFRCGEPDHLSRDCPEPRPSRTGSCILGRGRSICDCPACSASKQEDGIFLQKRASRFCPCARCTRVRHGSATLPDTFLRHVPVSELRKLGNARVWVWSPWSGPSQQPSTGRGARGAGPPPRDVRQNERPSLRRSELGRISARSVQRPPSATVVERTCDVCREIDRVNALRMGSSSRSTRKSWG